VAGYPAIYFVMAACAVASAARSLARWVPGQAAPARPEVTSTAADSAAG
jgi:hypothetical protein